MTNNYNLKNQAIRLFIIRIVGKIFAFVLFVLFARLMSLGSYGELVYFLSLVAVLSVISPLGLDILVLRHVYTFVNKKQTGFAKGIYRFSSLTSMIVALLLATTLIVIHNLTDKIANVSVEIIISLFLIMVLSAYMAIRRSFFMSVKNTIAAELPEAIIRQFFVICILLIFYFISDRKITTNLAVAIIAFSWVVTILVSKYCYDSKIRSIFDQTAAYRSKDWLKSSLPIMIVTLGFVAMAEIDIIVLANIAEIEDSAIYSVSTRYMQLFSLPLGVLQSIFASSLALFHRNNEGDKYTNSTLRISKLCLLIAIPTLIIIILIPEYLLSFFGQEYKEGASVLIILAITATTNAWFGVTGYSMTMTGKQNILAKLILFALILNFVLDIVLIPIMSIEGAAIATLISTLTWNTIAVFYIKKNLGYSVVWRPFSKINVNN